MKKNQKLNEKLDIVFLLDRSGSMNGTENDTIGGFNSYINSQKNKEANVTTVLFDDKYEILYKDTPINKVKKLTTNEYYTRGSTALLDAIGKTISMMEELKKKKVIFIITTDGYENSSTIYNKQQIKKLIEKHNTWEFIYIGANIDSYEEGTQLGIRKSNIANYQKSKKGINNLFGALEKASEMYYKEETLNDKWKENLE